MPSDASRAGFVGAGGSWRRAGSRMRWSRQDGALEALRALEAGPLRELESGLDALARGDLTVAIEIVKRAAIPATGSGRWMRWPRSIAGLKAALRRTTARAVLCRARSGRSRSLPRRCSRWRTTSPRALKRSAR